MSYLANKDIHQPVPTRRGRRSLEKSDQINLDVLRKYHGDICHLLNVNKSHLQQFAEKLYAKNVIDKATKILVTCEEEANYLLDYITLKVQQNPAYLRVVLELMENDEYLRDIVKKMKSKSEEEIIKIKHFNVMDESKVFPSIIPRDEDLIPEDEDLLIHLTTILEVTEFCLHLPLPTEDCYMIEDYYENGLSLQKVAVLQRWRAVRKRTWKEFIIPFALLGRCLKAKQLALEHSVDFNWALKKDHVVLKRCKDINNFD